MKRAVLFAWLTLASCGDVEHLPSKPLAPNPDPDAGDEGQGGQAGTGGEGGAAGSAGQAGSGGQAVCAPVSCPEQAPEGTCPVNWTLAIITTCPGLPEGTAEQDCMVSSQQGWGCPWSPQPFVNVQCCCPGGLCYRP